MAQTSLRVLFRKLHRLIFIYLGILMLLWVATGIMLSIPSEWLDMRVHAKTAPVDFRNARLSPAQAIASVTDTSASDTSASDTSTDDKVTSVEFRKVQDKLLYSFTLNGKAYMVDALTGKQFLFTPEMAESMVRKAYSIKTPLIENTVINKHTVDYSWGPLPVSYLRFEGESGGYIIKHANGNMHKNTFLNKMRFFSGMLHSFQPIRILLGSALLQHTVLILTAVVSLFGVLMGLYLVLPKRWQR